MKKKNKNKGSASIEATISLTAFIFVVMAIYSIVNFCIVQQRIAYAINTTAKEMSQYSYFYHVLSLDTLDEKLKKDKKQAVDTYDTFSTLIDDANAEISKIDEGGENYLISIINNPEDSDINKLIADINKSKESIVEAVNNPKEFVKSMIALAGTGLDDKLKSTVTPLIVKGMARKHFGKNSAEANEYLKKLGVIDGYDGVNFNLSTMFTTKSPQNIEIVAVYNMNLTEIFPFDLKVTICQRATTRAWLGGDLKLQKENSTK